MTVIYSIAGTALDNPAVISAGVRNIEVDESFVCVDDLAAAGLSAAIRPSPVAVRLAPDRSVEDLAPHVARINVVVLAFPGFADGRAFSQARLLRSRYRYSGNLRATGEVIQDQLAFMLSCGFDQFELPDGHEPPDFAAAMADARGFGNLLAGTALSSANPYRRTGT